MPAPNTPTHPTCEQDGGGRADPDLTEIPTGPVPAHNREGGDWHGIRQQFPELPPHRKHLCAGVLARVVPALANPAKLG